MDTIDAYMSREYGAKLTGTVPVRVYDTPHGQRLLVQECRGTVCVYVETIPVMRASGADPSRAASAAAASA